MQSLSRVYMDFISDLLSVTIEKLKNIDLKPDQTTHIGPDVLNSSRMSNSEENTSFDWERNTADESTQSTMSIPPINASEAQGCILEQEMQLIDTKLGEITVNPESTQCSSPIMYFQSSSTSCEDVIDQSPATNDRDAHTMDTLAPASGNNTPLIASNSLSNATEASSTIWQHGSENSQQYSVTSAILSAGIDASNMLRLLRSGAFRNRCRAQMEMGVSLNWRDALDMAGKVTLALKAMSVGISEDLLFLDPAQAGGLMGKSDGAIINVRGSKEMIEVKGCKCKKGKKFTVTLKDIRLDGTNFKHLFGVARKRDPSDWIDVDEYGQCDFWLAHVTRENLIKAMQESGRSHMRKVDATITPGSIRSWLGKYVKWIHFDNLTISWWMKNVMASSHSC